jgi:hypothetical protein
MQTSFPNGCFRIVIGLCLVQLTYPHPLALDPVSVRQTGCLPLSSFGIPARDGHPWRWLNTSLYQGV